MVVAFLLGIAVGLAIPYVRRFRRSAPVAARRFVVREGDAVRLSTDDPREAKAFCRAIPGSRLLDRGIDRTPRR